MSSTKNSCKITFQKEEPKVLTIPNCKIEIIEHSSIIVPKTSADSRQKGRSGKVIFTARKK